MPRHCVASKGNPLSYPTKRFIKFANNEGRHPHAHWIDVTEIEQVKDMEVEGKRGLGIYFRGGENLITRDAATIRDIVTTLGLEGAPEKLLRGESTR